MKAKKLGPSELADELGKIKARIKDLQELQDAMRNALLEEGVEEAHGKLFRVRVDREKPWTNVDYKGLLESLEVEISPQKKAKYTKRGTSIAVYVTAR